MRDKILTITIGFDTDELVGWDLPSDLAMVSMEEIEEDLALGHPAWGSLIRVSE